MTARPKPGVVAAVREQPNRTEIISAISRHHHFSVWPDQQFVAYVAAGGHVDRQTPTVTPAQVIATISAAVITHLNRMPYMVISNI